MVIESILNKNILDYKDASPLMSRLQEYLIQGKAIVLYFYPKDNTPGCTSQACELQIKQNEFEQLGVVTVGVSCDSVKSHENFSSKYDLNFPLLSDEDTSLCQFFDVWREKSMYGKKYMGIERSTFYIASSGEIKAVWRKVKVAGHWDQVLKEIKQL